MIVKEIWVKVCTNKQTTKQKQSTKNNESLKVSGYCQDLVISYYVHAPGDLLNGR